MTRPDLGPERPGHASETREMVERARTEHGHSMRGRSFVIAMIVIALGIVGVALLVR